MREAASVLDAVRVPFRRYGGALGAVRPDPEVFGITPVEAANRELRRGDIGWGDLDLVEPNVGHPLGASGVRILATPARGLRRRGGGCGPAAIRIGLGQGLAVVLEA